VVAAQNRSFAEDDAGDYAIMHPSLTRKFPPMRGAQVTTNSTAAGNQCSTSAISPPAPVSQKKSMLISTVGEKALPSTNSTGYFR
jgi:hypothetical protein